LPYNPPPVSLPRSVYSCTQGQEGEEDEESEEDAPEDIDEDDEDEPEEIDESDNEGSDYEEIEIGDEALIPVGDVEVPFGELRQAYLDKKAVEEHISTAKGAYEVALAERAAAEEALSLSKLEADLELEVYANMKEGDWREMARTRPQDYAEHKEYYDRMVAKRSKVSSQLEALNQRKQEQQQEERNQQIQQSLSVLQDRIPGFSKEVADEIVSHAINDLGAPESIAETIDPFVIIALHNSLQRKKGIQEAATKIRRKSKSAPVSQKKTRVVSKGIPSGLKSKGGKVDMVDLYQYLQD